jgi:hypothetical protein
VLLKARLRARRGGEFEGVEGSLGGALKGMFEPKGASRACV